MYRDKVRERFLTAMEKTLGKDFLVCRDKQCHLQRLAVGLFVNIRLYFALRDSNNRNASSSKRKNRKELKFSHL